MGVLNLNRSYNFVDKHGIVDAIRTAIQDSGEPLAYVAQSAGVSRGTLEGWLSGKTKKPYATNVEAVATALGMKLQLTGGKLLLIDNSPPPPTPARLQRWKNWRRS